MAEIEVEDLSVLSSWLMHAGAAHPLYDHLAGQAFRLLEERTMAVAALRGADDWRRRQAYVRRSLSELVGPFPERTDLVPRTVGTLRKSGFRVAKLVFESQPGFHVTACLFLPDRLAGPAPGVLYLLGHHDDGFRAAPAQRVILNLARKGFVVLTLDPLGQGERLQYYDPETGRSRIGGCTDEHSHVGVQCFLSGSCLARYRIWDAMRALDYLAGRPEVDPQRIGVTGCSGGGTLSAYLAAFDERVLAAASANYITSLRRLLESIGPQDAEQNLPRAVATGIDHADLLTVRAPRPLLIQSTTRDFFSIQGTRETFAEVQRAYEALGAQDRARLVEDDALHGTTPRTREALYAFFQEFLGQPGDPADEDVDYLTPLELQVTPTGQMATSLGGETAHSLNARRTEPLLGALATARGDLHQHIPAAVSAARRLSGYRGPAEPPESVFAGRYRREGYALEKYMLQGEGNYQVPCLLALPGGQEKRPALLYLHPSGKGAEAAPEGEPEWFARQGWTVLAPDLPGVGELADARPLYRWAAAFAGVLLGRSVAGVLAGDIARLLRYLGSREDVDPARIGAIARGELGAALLHAAAFEPAISRVALVGSLISYRATVVSRYHRLAGCELVAGALTAYDLPDLAAALAPRRLLLIDPADQNGNLAGEALVREDLGVVREAYAAAGATANLAIRTRQEWHTLGDVFGAWLEG